MSFCIDCSKLLLFQNNNFYKIYLEQGFVFANYDHIMGFYQIVNNHVLQHSGYYNTRFLKNGIDICVDENMLSNYNCWNFLPHNRLPYRELDSFIMNPIYNGKTVKCNSTDNICFIGDLSFPVKHDLILLKKIKLKKNKIYDYCNSYIDMFALIANNKLYGYLFKGMTFVGFDPANFKLNSYGGYLNQKSICYGHSSKTGILIPGDQYYNYHNILEGVQILLGECRRNHMI